MTDMREKRRMFWNVRAMPSLVMRSGLIPVIFLPSSVTVPSVRSVHPRDDVEHGGLSRAVGPYEADKFSLLETQVKVVYRDQSSKPHPHALNVQDHAGLSPFNRSARLTLAAKPLISSNRNSRSPMSPLGYQTTTTTRAKENMTILRPGIPRMVIEPK